MKPRTSHRTGAPLFRTLILAATALAAPLAGCQEEAPEEPPRQITSVSPFHYPEDLWDAGVEGETVLRLFVSSAGRPDSVVIERPSTHEAFDSAAVRGAPELRFEPAEREGQPVGTWVLLPVQFELPRADTASEPR